MTQEVREWNAHWQVTEARSDSISCHDVFCEFKVTAGRPYLNLHSRDFFFTTGYRSV